MGDLGKVKKGHYWRSGTKSSEQAMRELKRIVKRDDEQSQKKMVRTWDGKKVEVKKNEGE